MSQATTRRDATRRDAMRGEVRRGEARRCEGCRVARALSRQRSFPGRRLLLNLFALPLALPGLVIVLGVIEVWGRNGWLSAGLRALGIA